MGNEWGWWRQLDCEPDRSLLHGGAQGDGELRQTRPKSGVQRQPHTGRFVGMRTLFPAQVRATYTRNYWGLFNTRLYFVADAQSGRGKTVFTATTDLLYIRNIAISMDNIHRSGCVRPSTPRQSHLTPTQYNVLLGSRSAQRAAVGHLERPDARGAQHRQPHHRSNGNR